MIIYDIPSRSIILNISDSGFYSYNSESGFYETLDGKNINPKNGNVQSSNRTPNTLPIGKNRYIRNYDSSTPTHLILLDDMGNILKHYNNIDLYDVFLFGNGTFTYAKEQNLYAVDFNNIVTYRNAYFSKLMVSTSYDNGFYLYPRDSDNLRVYVHESESLVHPNQQNNFNAELFDNKLYTTSYYYKDYDGFALSDSTILYIRNLQ
jgi:hypothetical protein